MEAISDWRLNAACARTGYSPDIWFANPAEHAGDRAGTARARENVRTARDVCRVCVARSECLDYALRRPFLQGIWGGLSADERTTMRQVRARRDDGLLRDLYPEPDITAYLAQSQINKNEGVLKALRARRICPECGEEKTYYISRLIGRCRDCDDQKSMTDS